MPIDGEYEPSTWGWVREQVEGYESSGGTRGNTLRDSGMPIIVMTTVGHRSGKVRKVPLMRVEHDGEYAVIASKGGAPEHPAWYHNLVADPRVMIQDGPAPFHAEVRIVTGDEPVVLEHEEHDPLPVAPGAWEIRRQREYTPQPWRTRWVAD